MTFTGVPARRSVPQPVVNGCREPRTASLFARCISSASRHPFWVGKWMVVVLAVTTAVILVCLHREPQSPLVGTAEVPVLLSVKNQRNQRIIEGTENLNPVVGQDFLLFVWVKPSRMPTPTSRAIVVLKFDPHRVTRPGFAVAFAQSAQGLRPEVYWKGASVRGGWYSFPELEIPLHKWTLLALSYRADRFLGLHAVVNREAKGASFKTLGGHVVDGTAPPEARVPIDVGAIQGGSSFRGDIGPLGVITGRQLEEHLLELLRAINRDPRIAPALPPSLGVTAFFADRSLVLEGR